MLPSIGSSGGTTGISSSYLNQLIQASLAQHRRPLALLQQERDIVDIRRAVYRDLDEMLSTLKTLTESWTSSENSVMAAKRITSSDNSLLTASALRTAAPGSYSVQVSKLAQAHQVRSSQVLYHDQPLGLSGTFVLGSRAERAAEWTPDAEGVVAGGGTASIASGQLELKSGSYYVETRQFEGSWQFRVVDANGKAVNIASQSNPGSYSSDWQNMQEGAFEYDSGRGLTISFGEERAAALRPESAMVNYSAKGATLEVNAGHSLNDIRDMVNNATFAEGEGVRATIVDRQLVLTSSNTGADYALRISTIDAPTGNVLTELGLWNESESWLSELKVAQDAQFTINGIQVTRSRNTALDDIIAGVTINLLGLTSGENSITLTVSDDNTAVTNQISTFINRFNSVTNYLSSKTATTKNSDGTYTRGTLAGDMIFNSLRLNLITDIISPAAGLGVNAPRNLQAIGITFDVDTMQLKVSDSSALNNALETNRSGVGELLESIMGRIENRLNTFTGTSGILNRSVEQLDYELTALNNRKLVLEERLTAQEELLTRRYSLLLQQYADLQAQATSMTSLLNSLS